MDRAFPVDSVLPEIFSALKTPGEVVLSAEPGAGKTTRVPPALLNESWLEGRKIIMLEPRRLAAQRSAAFMARQLGEKTGETVGFRIRGESKVGPRTRIEVVTEGVLTRILQDDPSLPGSALIIFDEFHERSIHADLGLALILDVKRTIREDLRLLIMSATLDGLALSRLLPAAFVITTSGRSFPVSTRYLDRNPDGPIERSVAASIQRALREQAGDILVFLPGQGEIRRVDAMLAKSDLPPGVTVHTLYGDAPPEKQSSALSPAPPGTRKVILSTSIAETSLTIDGVRCVIDSGLARGPRFDPRRGMSGLVTSPVSRAVADQRRGRAGRQSPGECYRLWTESRHEELQPFPVPEILVADLAPFALEIARWGTPPENLTLLDPPPVPHLSQARRLLEDLGAINQEGKLTHHGRAMTEMPVHPRLAHMLLRARDLGLGSMACEVAALLEDRDPLRGGPDVDLFSRWHLLRSSRSGENLERIRSEAARLRRILNARDHHFPADRLGLLVALAYPEWIGKRRKNSDRYLLANGSGAVLPKGNLLREEYLAVAAADGAGNEVKVFLAAPLAAEDLRHFAISSADEVRWDEREESVVARRVSRLGALELSEAPLSPPAELIASALLGGIRSLGLDSLPWDKSSRSMRSRSEWLRKSGLAPAHWPDLSDECLLDGMEQWLSPYLMGITRRSQFAKINLSAAMSSKFSGRQLHELERLAPTHLTVPTGSRIPLRYDLGPSPVLAVRLQEMFGQKAAPAVADGRVKVLIHLLSPAGRALAVTQDLPSFWGKPYQEVRKGLRGKYPKHYWPEDPLQAKPTRRTVKR